MFGYINVVKDELKIKEYNVFRAFYCGLCRAQGEIFGNISRLSLSYDFTFLAILLSSLSGAEYSFYNGRCTLHPMQKKTFTSRNAILDYCSHMSVALAYYKIKDDINDKSFSKKAVGYPFFAPYMKKIRARFTDKLRIIEENLNRLSSYENENIQNIDLTSDTFGKIMEEIFDFDAENSAALRVLGYNIGKWLYTVDAIDDFGDDVKNGNFNPFKTTEDIQNAEVSVWYNLSEAAKAYELLDIIKNKDLLNNIIYINLNASTVRVLEKSKERYE